MYQRDIEKELIERARGYPIIGVIGPRQSGKTTLVKNTFPHFAYLNLEEPDVWELVKNDPRKILDSYPDGLILDEVQRLPELFSYLQVYADRYDKPGQFILTGSNQFTLLEKVTQSLAGRIALLDLLPLSLEEQSANLILKDTLEQRILNGGYPRVYKQSLDPSKFYRDYIRTYLERDVRQIINVQDLRLFQHFIKLCAGRVGQELNMSNLANELGISSHTIKKWISVLESSFIIFLLQPYYENLGKRLTKSPKLYFTDVGIACFLLNIQTAEHLERDPLRGNLIENLVVLELYKTRLNRGMEPNLYYYRDQRYEIDVIYKKGHWLIPIEIKASKTIHKDFFKGIRFLKNLVPDRILESYLIYSGDIKHPYADVTILNYLDTHQIAKSD